MIIDNKGVHLHGLQHNTDSSLNTNTITIMNMSKIYSTCDTKTTEAEFELKR